MSIHNDNPTSPPTDDWGLEPLMDVHELAADLGIPISTVYDWLVALFSAGDSGSVFSWR